MLSKLLGFTFRNLVRSPLLYLFSNPLSCSLPQPGGVWCITGTRFGGTLGKAKAPVQRLQSCYHVVGHVMAHHTFLHLNNTQVLSTHPPDCEVCWLAVCVYVCMSLLTCTCTVPLIKTQCILGGFDVHNTSRRKPQNHFLSLQILSEILLFTGRNT